MSDLTRGTTCPRCGDEDLEVEIIVESAGSPGHYGLPEFSSPGEGPEWYIDGDVECAACGAKLTEEEITTLQEDAALSEGIQRRIMEQHDYD